MAFGSPDHTSDYVEVTALGPGSEALRAMIDNLIQTLPAQCHPQLQQELSLLDREIARNFLYPEELALARIADSQGLGGRSGKSNLGTRIAQ